MKVREVVDASLPVDTKTVALADAQALRLASGAPT